MGRQTTTNGCRRRRSLATIVLTAAATTFWTGPAQAAGIQYEPLPAPQRIADTRSSGDTVDGQFEATGAVAAGQVLQLQVGGRAGVAGDAAAATLNVTAVGANGPGYLTVYPCDQPPADVLERELLRRDDPVERRVRRARPAGSHVHLHARHGRRDRRRERLDAGRGVRATGRAPPDRGDPVGERDVRRYRQRHRQGRRAGCARGAGDRARRRAGRSHRGGAERHRGAARRARLRDRVPVRRGRGRWHRT